MHSNETPAASAAPIAFRAETRQLLDILIHSLYTEREIFLRELISNASDALSRLDFELLTNRDVLDPEAEHAIRILPNQDEKTLTVEDTGIGMTSDDLVANLGTIAHSGAREFISAARQGEVKADELIGQFGVGFYSAFMVAESIRVTSRSFKKDGEAATWFCTGSDTFTVEPADRQRRGTSVTLKLNEDAYEYLEEERLREVIRKHSDFIPFPIYIGESQEQVNRQTALWRQQPRQVEQKDYDDFYKQLTLDFEPPLAHTHMVVDAPAQLFAILYIPVSSEHNIFALRKEDGLKLYARKVLIQEYSRDLLPEYFGFVQGVVDSEDLPLNVSRETVQSSRAMAQIKKLLTPRVMETLKKLAEEDKDKYLRFWEGYARYIKQGVAIEQNQPEELYPLLRFKTITQPGSWVSLDEVVQEMKADQEEIFYIMGDDERSVLYSPHLDVIRHYGYSAILLTDPVDAFMLARLKEYQGHKLSNVASADLKLPELDKGEVDQVDEEAAGSDLVERFKARAGRKG